MAKKRHQLSKDDGFCIMTQKLKKYYLFAILTLLVFLVAIFAMSRFYSPKSTLPLGEFKVTDGRVEGRTKGTREWTILNPGDKAYTGMDIRVGSNGSATLRDDHFQLVMSPDTNISTKTSTGLIELRLESGEIKIETASTDVSYLLATEFGSAQFGANTGITLTKPAQKSYAVVSVQKGEVDLKYNEASRSHKKDSRLTPEMGAKILSSSTQSALWLVSPGPEDVIAGKEGFAALSLLWSGTELPGNLLLRNLTSGEMMTRENSASGMEITLPAGSYSWVINSGGSVTSPRRFHIAGNNGDAPVITPLPAQIAETPAPEQTPPATPSMEETPKQAEAHNPPENVSEPPQNLPENPQTKPVESESPKAEDSTPRDVPEVKLLEPKKGAEIPVSAIAERRITWSVTKRADTLELEVLGSAGNPSLRFTLEGTRSRQKLTTLPPGRYAVRLRGISGKEENAVASEWTERFFDVIQTEAGQMAPTAVKAALNTTGNPMKLIIQFKKSPAPQYQVRVISAGEPATIIRTKKPKVVLPAPKSGQATVSVCALDANLHIRGCAPDVSVP